MPLNSQLPTNHETRNAHLDAQAMNALFGALNVDEFNRVSNLENAHDIWTTISKIHEGTSMVPLYLVLIMLTCLPCKP